MDISVEQKIARRLRWLIILSLFTVLLSIISTLLIVNISILWTRDRNERRAREFVENVVDSINQHTEYYKHHCSKQAIEDIEGSIAVITANYKISVIEAEPSYYEYDVTFDGKNKFRFDVIRWPERGLEVIGLMPIPTRADR